MDLFSPATAAWFESAFPAGPSHVQRAGWPAIATGEHCLVVAPTGSGKTLTAFLWAIDRLLRLQLAEPQGVRVLYVSPLKALVVDVEKNLRAPLAGVLAASKGPMRPIRVDVRTGDTKPADRRAQLKKPAEILVTTPESLYLLLGTRARETLRLVDTVIIDEIHALAGTKRGAHLALSLERLSALTLGSGGAEPQRIGLSATARPLDAIGRYLVGDRPVRIVDEGRPPDLDVQVVVTGSFTTLPKPEPKQRRRAGPQNTAMPPRGLDDGIWATLVPALHAQILAHRSTIVFVNSRLLCERVSVALQELAPGADLIRAHHGSLSHERRTETEQMLKDGQLRAIVATSSLELGIDMGLVDLVIQVESPKAVSRALQRVGRAGHHVGGRPIGRIYPKHRGDLLEAAVVAGRMAGGGATIESTRIPVNCLDVLAQQVVAIASTEPIHVDALYRLVRRSEPYAMLPREAFEGVLDMLAGRYPSEAFAELRPRIAWDRAKDEIRGLPGSAMLALVNAGTIPDRGLYAVHAGEKGPRIGELDEEMVHESRRGDVIRLGASSWRVDEIGRDRVTVVPAPGEPGRLPFWRGEGPGRPLELGRALGAFVRELTAVWSEQGPEAAIEAAQRMSPLDAMAASNLVTYLQDQAMATEAVPDDTTIVVERFRDEVGDWRICILSPFGGRVHQAWALALESRLEGLQILTADDGIAFRALDADQLPGLLDVIPDPDEVEAAITAALGGSPRFATRFREAAARALLLPRRHPGRRTPLWAQRMRASSLLAVAERFPSFPMVLEAYRECLAEDLDVPGLVEICRAIRSREIRVVERETRSASPFAQTLAFAWVARFLYEGDAPLAERRAAALVLDRRQLRELLGEASLRELIDEDVRATVESDLQRLDWGIRDADGVHGLLRRLGDLDAAELATRGVSDEWLHQLRREGRAVPIRIGGAERWVTADDAARYRDGVGAEIPADLPEALRGPVEEALLELVVRWARTHGPFMASVLAVRWSTPIGAISAALALLAGRGALERDVLDPGDACDPDVLRRMRREALTRLRREIAPVDPPAFARFLIAWNAVGIGARGLPALRQALIGLEGCPLPLSELESRILPARVADYRPAMLDELGALGEFVWIGQGALGASDGRVMLVRRDRVGRFAPTPEGSANPIGLTVVDHLQRRGASFLVELLAATSASGERLHEALRELIFAGRITNDTFAPLRGLFDKGGISKLGGGRWSLVPEPSGTAEERMVARAEALLARYGVVGREAVLHEGIPGGFAALVPVLRVMEDHGTARRGAFVAGLAGAPYAMPGAVDRLRAAQKEVGKAGVLAATDPANPWGALLDWPSTGCRRVPGASLVHVGGEPILFVEKGGKGIVTFAGAESESLLREAVTALRGELVRQRKRSLRVERIDGQPATDERLRERFVAVGFVSEWKGLLLAV